MIVERSTFQLKFGKSKEAIALWKAMMDESKRALHVPEIRLLSDLSGEAYTLVVELHLKDMIEFNQKQAVWGTTGKVQEMYQQFIPLCEHAHRELLKIEDETGV